MSSKLEKIIKIVEQAGATKVTVWTESFKATGTVVKEESKIVKDIVTLKGVTVSSLFYEYENEESEEEVFEELAHYDWLNIFEDKIISFTAVK